MAKSASTEPETVSTPDGDRLDPARPEVDVSELRSLFNEDGTAAVTDDDDDDAPPPPAPEPEPAPAPASEIEPTTPSDLEPPATEAESPSLLSMLQEQGFQDLDDESSALSRLGEYMLEQREQQQQLQRQLEDERRLAAVYRAQSQGTTQAADTSAQPESSESAAQPADDKWWNPPTVNQKLVEKFRTSEGSWAEGTPPEVIQQAEAYNAYHEDWMYRLAYEPDKVVSEIEDRIIQRVQPLLNTTLETRTAEQQAQYEQQEFISSNPWIWRQDPVTNQPTEQFSQAGEAVRNMAAAMAEEGMSELRAWQFAARHYQLEQQAAGNMIATPEVAPAAPAANPAQDAASLAEQRRKEHLARSRQIPDRSGTLQPASSTDPPPRQDPKLSPGEQLLRELQSSG